MRHGYGVVFALWLSLHAFATVSGSDGPVPAHQVPTEVPTQKPAVESRTKDGVGPNQANPSPAKRRRRSKATPNGGPRKVVVREGGAEEPAAQIAPNMSAEEATRQRREAEQMLGSADNQLRLLTGRTLGSQQEEAVGQIHNYMDGARSALKEGDVRRANTLAQKAHLLADDLVKH
jgi:hypothetical protein